MNDVKDKIADLSGHVTDYLDTQYQLGMLKVTEKAANTAAFAVTGFTVIIFTLLVLITGGIGIGWWLGDIINNMAAGFLIVAGFYLLCLLCIIIFRKRLIFPLLRNRIVSKIYE